jgi:ATP-dependent exoDNAse (exonuclease V) beta subunit
MSDQTRFKIYDASAGSGKTYTLVKEFLTNALSSSSASNYQSALAITFTNKAVQEMKTRLLEVLTQFSDDTILSKPTPLFAELAQTIGINHNQLQQRSRSMLAHLLQHYSHFSISTIDSLTHHVVRAFSRDLGLLSGFELALDTKKFLTQAVDLLIEKAGTDKQLTQVLLRFVKDKAAQDKSWDVAYDLNKIAALIHNENHHKPLKEIASKTWDDFILLEQQLKGRKNQALKQIIDQTKQLQEELNHSGIQVTSFSYGELPKKIDNIFNGKWEGLPGKRLTSQIQNGSLLKKTASKEELKSIEALQPNLEAWLENITLHLPTIYQTEVFLAQLAPLSVLNAIQKCLEELQTEQNTVLLSSLNAIIAKTIHGTPTPFIYERLGVRYQHYYIDEFQDTSALQWGNLSSLADHALSSEQGKLMLVGDAKQAIYRWRGGLPEQFMALSKGNSPFPGIKPVSIRLPKNYRSLDNIVEVNNSFFQFVAEQLKNPEHQDLYTKGSEQIKLNHPGGWTTISFVQGDRVDTRTPHYLEATLARVKDAISRGYSLSDICILVRKRKHGVEATTFLNQHSIPVVSAETLLIDQSPEVRVLLSMIRLRADRENKAARRTILTYFMPDDQDEYVWFSSYLSGDVRSMFEAICLSENEFSFEMFCQKDTYSALEYVIESFGLTQEVSAFLSGFLEEVLQQNTQKPMSDAMFLDYWDNIREQRAVSVPENLEAVRVMTIHKAKGLAFPVVIIPFADTPIFDTHPPESWFPVDPNLYAGFQNMFVRVNTQLQNTGPFGEALFRKHREEQMLDAVNVLYVGMTRPERELHLVTHESDNTTGSYAGLLTTFVKQQNPEQISDTCFGFGNPTSPPNPSSNLTAQTKATQWISNSTPAALFNNRKLIWDQSQQDAISYGNLFHDLMAEIYVPADLEVVIQRALSQGKIGNQEADVLRKKMQSIVNTDELKDFFKIGARKFREHTLFGPNGEQLRPDSFVLLPNRKVSILDYKTGSPQQSHEEQLKTYANCFEKMGYKIERLYIVYLGDVLKLKRIY